MIWQLVVQAEQLPAEERPAFLQSAHADSFVIGEAMAILQGSESFSTAAPSFPSGTEGRFVPQTGMKIGRYRVGTLLGSGGAGSVYSAFDEELNRPVAIKFFADGQRFASPRRQRDSRNAATLSTPCLLTLEIKLVSIARGNGEQFEELPCASCALPAPGGAHLLDLRTRSSSSTCAHLLMAFSDPR